MNEEQKVNTKLIAAFSTLKGLTGNMAARSLKERERTLPVVYLRQAQQDFKRGGIEEVKAKWSDFVRLTIGLNL